MPNQGYKNSGGDRNAERVVDKREEKILPDVAHHRAAQANGFSIPLQIALEQSDAGALHRDIRAGPHRDANIRGGKRRRVVDSIAGHGDDLILFAQLPDALVLVLRLNPASISSIPSFPPTAARRALVVAGEHNDLDAELMQIVDRGQALIA